MKVQAAADKQAAIDKGEAITTLAHAEAEAAKTRAQGVREMGQAEAAREQALNEARNKLSQEIIEYELTRERIRVIPLALAEAVKPLEKISDIRIFDAGGFMGGKANGQVGAGSFGDGLVGQLLAYRANAPLLDKILAEAGFTGADPMQAMTNALRQPNGPAAAPGASGPDKKV